MSLRSDLLASQKARFALITTANEYKTNIGQKLKLWHEGTLDDAQLDAIIIRDTIDTKQPDDPNSGRKTHHLRMIVDAVFKPGADNEANAQKARDAIEDIYKAVALDPRWTVEGQALARRTDEVSAQIMVAPNSTTVAGAQVIYDIVTSRSPWAT